MVVPAGDDPEFYHCCPGLFSITLTSTGSKARILEQSNGPHLPPARLVELNPQKSEGRDTQLIKRGTETLWALYKGPDHDITEHHLLDCVMVDQCCWLIVVHLKAPVRNQFYTCNFIYR